LHANCAHCHRFGGGGTAKIELGFEQRLEDKVVNQPPTQGTFGITSAVLVKPGDPYHSLLYYRMAKTGGGHMPHLAAELVDERGLALIHDWIRSLSAAPAENPWLDKLRSLEAEAAVDARPDKPPIRIGELLASTSAALAVSRVVADKQVSGTLAERLVEAGVSHRDSSVRDLFERFIPDERRAGRLGHRFKMQDVLALQGNAERGKTLFFDTASLQCKTCHRVKDEGGRVGPDLTAVGKKLTRQQILESLAEPSKLIAQEYRTHLFETGDGRTYTGIIGSKSEKEIVIRDAADKETRLPVGDIERSAALPQSIMPERLLRDLTPQQAADLVEYLSLLR
jgi:putative heme-binding domain-containing protein